MAPKLWPRALVALVAAAGSLCGLVHAAPASASASVSGVAFQDLDGDAVRDAGEAPFAGHQLYLYTSAGSYLGTTVTDGDGAYGFDVSAAGPYTLTYATGSWDDIKATWVPAVGDVWPKRTSVAAGSRVDWPWRPIRTSSDANLPISTHQGPTGLTVKSYTDAVSASRIHDALAALPLGAEAASTEVRFGLGSGNCTNVGVAGDAATGYRDFHAVSWVDYSSWLEFVDAVLVHEYGHAWGSYHTYITHQDGTLANYVEARGLAGDARVNSSYYWNANEMLAEDFRQLFGSATAAAPAQDNRDIPPAASVAGLRDYLAGSFRQASEPSPTPAPAPAPMAISSASMSPNPVVSSGTASFETSAAGSATVAIHDKRGNLVRSLATKAPVGAGASVVVWDRTDTRGRRVKAGDYELRVTAVDAAGNTATTAVRFKVA